MWCNWCDWCWKLSLKLRSICHAFRHFSNPKKAAQLSQRIMITFSSKANAHFYRQPVFTPEFVRCQTHKQTYMCSSQYSARLPGRSDKSRLWWRRRYHEYYWHYQHSIRHNSVQPVAMGTEKLNSIPASACAAYCQWKQYCCHTAANMNTRTAKSAESHTFLLSCCQLELLTKKPELNRIHLAKWAWLPTLNHSNGWCVYRNKSYCQSA